MTFTKVPRMYGETLPICDDCDHFRITLTENEAGGTSGVKIHCDLDNRILYKGHIACIKHTELGIFTDVLPPDNSRGVSLDSYDVSQAYLEMEPSIKTIVGCVLTSSLDRTFSDHIGSTEIARALTRLRVLLLDDFSKYLDIRIRALVEDNNAQMGEYIMQAVETLRKELTEDVQDNGEIQP